MKPNGALSLGETLKEMRQTAHLNIAALSEKTKIQKKYLQRLEAEEFDRLPPAVYVRGFVKYWAEACSADVENALIQFDRVNTFFIQKQNQEKRLGMASSPSFIITSRHLFGVLGVALLVGLAVYFGYQYFFLAKQPHIEIMTPASMELVVQNKWLTIEGQTEDVMRLTVAGQEVYIEKDGRFEKTLALNEGINLIRIEGEGRNGQSIEVTRKVVRVE